jgi:hypothetical protein
MSLGRTRSGKDAQQRHSGPLLLPLPQWFDQNSFEVKKLVLSYYMTDGTVQLVSSFSTYAHPGHIPLLVHHPTSLLLTQVDHDSKKNFLKRIAYPSLSIAELFIGNSITM